MTKTITDRLISMDPTLSTHNEGSWGGGTTETDYVGFNDAGVECETGEFLYSMVRILKPEHILETGTHWGIGSSYLALACEDNNKGMVDTIEFLPEIRVRAVERFTALGLTHRINSHFMDARLFQPDADVRYRLILLDTEPQTRFEELIRYFDFLEQGGFVFIHDLHRHMHQIPNEEHGFAWPFGEIPDRIKTWVKEGQLRPFHFPTPRGLTGFYKPSDSDYQW